jgi:succinate dehydrogenase/fumarate reductase flavoprotein subunit
VIRQLPYLADGYLTEGESLSGLAVKLGMDPARLEATVARFNSFAHTGMDADFGRGETAYYRVNGDAAWAGPNPSLGPLTAPPFYAVRLQPGDIGASAGLSISRDAEVLRDDGSPIAGLYACGNEARSIMGGTYPGPGITIGPAIVFAHRAMSHVWGDAA